MVWVRVVFVLSCFDSVHYCRDFLLSCSLHHSCFLRHAPVNPHPSFSLLSVFSLTFDHSSRLLLYHFFDPVLGSLPLPLWLLSGIRATPSHLTLAAHVVSGLSLHLPAQTVLNTQGYVFVMFLGVQHSPMRTSSPVLVACLFRL